MDIYNEWINDLPQQFQGKQNIEYLIRVFARQMQEIYEVFGQLKNETDLDTAIGKNLDVVGDIVNLSRKDAHIILRKAKDTEITDEIYRRVLKYKSIQNSCDCTYYDMMYSLSLLWNTDNISYLEPPDRPATVLLKINKTSLDSIDPAIGRILVIRPSGVSVIYTIEYWEKIFFMEYKKITLEKVNMHWKFSFFTFWFGEYKTLDGTWLLDGSVLLNATDISIPILMKCHGIVAENVQNTEARTIIKSDLPQVETYQVSHLLMKDREKIIETSNVDVSLEVTSETKYENDISCTLISRRNFWCLDGSVLLDGSRCFNAEQIKEVI